MEQADLELTEVCLPLSPISLLPIVSIKGMGHHIMLLGQCDSFVFFLSLLQKISARHGYLCPTPDIDISLYFLKM